MSKILAFIYTVAPIAFASAIPIPVIAGTITLDFENLTTTSVSEILPIDYAGFNWSGGDWELVSDIFMTRTEDFANTYDSPNGDYAVDSKDGLASVIFTHQNDFDFLSFDASTYAYQDTFESWSSLTLTVEGYNNGSFIGSSVFDLSSTSYTNFSANLLGVDEIRFLNDGVSTYRYWLADNFLIETSTVPAPAAFWLFSSGLVGLIGMRKKSVKLSGKRNQGVCGRARSIIPAGVSPVPAR